MIEVNNIVKKYGKKVVLKDVSFHANRGECIGILGMNGSGKSTLLSILAGVLSCDKGEIIYGGNKVTKNPKLYQKFVGYIPQDNPLIEELTVKDNLKLWYSSSQSDLSEALKTGFPAKLELDEFIHVPVKKLSGGMKKRVSLACALIHTPPILIMDEPSVALDFIYKEEIYQFMQAYLERMGTILITTHDESDLHLCSRWYVMQDGILKEVPSHVTKEELVASFKDLRN